MHRSPFPGWRFTYLAAACLLLANAASAQQVSGKVTDENGAARAGARVRFEPGGNNATTDQDGAFKIEGLKDGSYTVTVRSDGRAPQSFAVRVKAAHLSPETLKLQRTAEQRVSGRVVDRDGKGLVGLRVTISVRRDETVLTDSEGRFFLTAPPGAHKITVNSDDKTQNFEVTVADGRLTPTELTF
jgi:Carboxypeptidase regulatory-like domain